MYIEELVVEGFKSYAQKTVISGWSSQFNAITGLNGSGKSNILDSICFVLGISNLSQVRASNLQELIYKHGQSTVSKATVSIVFNNSDRKSSPIGYEHCSQITISRQIAVGGRNKYLINGHNAQPARVQNLFQSVGLNVNNPHFLIMQGRITKVLNMKPLEILGMLEEASGTRMYEVKKENALKTIEKKSSKILEIDNILSLDILPALDKLRSERAQYMEWSSQNHNVEKMRRLCIAYEYFSGKTTLDLKECDVADLKNKSETLAEIVNRARSKYKEDVGQLKKLKDSQEIVCGGDLFSNLNEKIEKCSSLLVLETTMWQQKCSELQKYKDNLEDAVNSLATAEREKLSAEVQLESSREKSEMAEIEANNARKTLEEIQLASEESNEGRNAKIHLQQQLDSCKEKMKIVMHDQQILLQRKSDRALRLKRYEEELVSHKPNMLALESEHNNLVMEINSCKNRLATCQFDSNVLNTLNLQLFDIESSLERLDDILESSESRFGLSLTQSYRESFSKESFLGRLVDLFQVPNSKYCHALEIIAGNKLQHFVVDCDETAKAIIKFQGKLNERTTLIPLESVKSTKISENTLNRVKKISNGKAHLAVDVVSFDSRVGPALNYAFGNTLICEDMESAKALAFDKQINVKCVTLDGDVFDPRGTLSGGCAQLKRKGLVTLCKEISDLQDEKINLSEKKRDLSQKCKMLEKEKKLCTELEGNLELKEHKLKLIVQRQISSKSQKILDEIEQSQKAIESMESKLSSHQLNVNVLSSQIDNLSQKIHEAEQTQKEMSCTITTRIEAAKLEYKRCECIRSSAKYDEQAIRMECAALQGEVDALNQQKKELNEQCKEFQVDIDQIGGRVEILNEEHSALQSARMKLFDQNTTLETQITELSLSISLATSIVEEQEQELQLFAQKIKRAEKEFQQLNENLQQILCQNQWIKDEQHLFGTFGSPYDFENLNMKGASEIWRAKQCEQDRLSKRINKKAVTMFERAEREYSELIQKKNIIQKDKAKITEVIDELDSKKREALNKVHERVNEDFSSIFGTLLPGASATLHATEGKNLIDGLQVKVAFGRVWKDSLSELSGGQRSLLALSLILALLLFKPAPLYILDEVDAALDLSHTQNIGRMIKSHFPQSQFLVVSLKDGMFNNADVLYKTSFCDGVSTIQRTVPTMVVKEKSGAILQANVHAINGQ